MLRKIHLLTLALLAAAIAAPIGQAKPDDPLALSILRERAGGSIAESQSKAVDPLAVSMLRGRGWSASRIYDWTEGACSYQVKPSSCYLSTAQAHLASERLAQSMGGPSPTPIPAAAFAGSGGFQWNDALIGAGVTAGVLLLGAGGALVLYRRRELAH